MSLGTQGHRDDIVRVGEVGLPMEDGLPGLVYKWLGSPPFKSHVNFGHLEEVPQPTTRSLKDKNDHHGYKPGLLILSLVTRIYQNIRNAVTNVTLATVEYQG